MSRRWSIVAVVASAACFGTLAVLAPLAYESGAKPLPLLAWRFAISATLLAILAVSRDRTALRISAGDLGRYSLLALTGYGASSICFFYALAYADAAIVAVLLYAYPSIVTVAGWLFLGERATWRKMMAVATTFTGCALIVGLGSGGVRASWQGIALGLGAALGYSVFSLLSHRWLPGRSRLTMMTYMFGIAAVLPAVATLATSGAAGLSTAAWTSTTWLLVALIVCVPTFAAVVMYLKGIRGLGASQAAILSTVEPAFTIVLSWLLLNQQALTLLQLVGVALVLGGVVGAEVDARSAAEPAAL